MAYVWIISKVQFNKKCLVSVVILEGNPAIYKNQVTGIGKFEKIKIKMVKGAVSLITNRENEYLGK